MLGIRKVIAAGLAGALALPLLTASAEAATWWIERMSGNVQIHDGESWVRLEADRTLNAGDSIWTGRNGRILLMNNQGSVLLAPKSLVKIPAQTLPNNFSVLFQTHGTVSADVTKRRKRHFSIQTPYLATVVKGTEFDVEIEKKQTRVAVREGLVGVADIDTGETVDVPAGYAVSTAAKAGGPLGQVVATAAPGESGSSSSPNGRGGSGDNGRDNDDGNGNAYGKGKGNAHAYGKNKSDDNDDQ